MSKNYHIKNATLVNEGKQLQADVFTSNGLIQKISEPGSETPKHYHLIDASGKFLLPGIIDDQVHFREPGLTHKADMYTESKAAVAGGITSFMEMPNTNPQTLTQELLEEKYQLASQKSLANYSFYMGASNNNLQEVLKTDPGQVCGLKIFMGSSTGNMLVDDMKVLEEIFSQAPLLIAVHCEDETTIRKNNTDYLKAYGINAPARIHPQVRSAEACYISSSRAVSLAKKHNSRLHILHLSTAEEMELFSQDIPLSEKRITAEVCVHHLWFSSDDYGRKGNFIKWNPAVKAAEHREALWNALLDGRLDVVATDHAPHTFEEKSRPYFEAPSGGPLVQHALVAMLEQVHRGRLSIEMLVEKMCHNPAICFQLRNRGFIRTGYAADLALVDIDYPNEITREQLQYKCGWSPFDGYIFQSKVMKTFVNGILVYDDGEFYEDIKGQRLTFNR